MKKTLLLGICMCATLIGVSQSSRNFPERKTRTVLPQHPTSIVRSGERAIIWSDNFSVAGNWTTGVVASTPPAPATDPDTWVIGTTEPNGPFAIPGIESTTAANGFALFDSDLYCGGNQQAYVATASPIDLSSYPGAVLEFEQFFRGYYGECFVDISVDGTNWTETLVNEDVEVNTSTTNPDLRSVDISSMVAGQATVWVRFRYYSSTEVHGANAGCDYAWMVDDVAIVELEPYNLVLNYGVISHTGTGEEYGRVPQNQLSADMNFGAEVHNFGSLGQTGLTLHVLVTDDASATVVDETFNLGDLAAGQLANMDELITLPVLADGIYDVDFSVSSNEFASESNPDDNAITRQFAIDGDVYALDGIGVYDANELSATGSNSFAGAADGLEIMTYYELAVPTTVYGVSAELANGTEVNSAVIVSLHDTTQVFNDNLNTPLAQSDVITVTAADLAAGRVIGLFLPPANLPAGGYYASVRLLSAANEYEILVLDDVTIPQPGNASLIYDPSDQTVYGNGNASAVRLQLNATVGVNDRNALEGVTMYPNPTHGMLHVSTPYVGQHKVEVVSMLGEVALNTRFSGTASIDLSTLAKGIYTVRVSHTSGSWVQRVAVD